MPHYIVHVIVLVAGPKTPTAKTPCFVRFIKVNLEICLTEQDNQKMLKGVVSFYYTYQITPKCFGSMPRQLATPSKPQSTSTRGADNTGVACKERVTP
jgi:hypothetical protein